MTIRKTSTPLRGKSMHFWLLLAGLAISSMGTSMVWPFLMIYAKTQLNLPMVIVTFLMIINSVAAFIGSLIAGLQLDLRGRKWILVSTLLAILMIYPARKCTSA